jgi:hypothetical protein
MYSSYYYRCCCYRRSCDDCYDCRSPYCCLLQQSTDDQEIDITQRSCMASHRKLGVHENHQKSENGATDFSSIDHSLYEAWIAYRSIYLPNMRYSLPATSSANCFLPLATSSPILNAHSRLVNICTVYVPSPGPRSQFS